MNHATAANRPETKWLTVFRPVQRPRARLFCFPYAGAGASAFRLWPQWLPPDVELCAVQLPGRENRINDRVPGHMGELVPPLLAAIRPWTDVRFALFGHSLGAAIAYEIARALFAVGHPPRLLCVSGRRPPHQPLDKAPLHRLPDPELKDVLARMGGTPPEILAHAELMDFLLPTLRADLRLSESYLRDADRRVTCPIVAFAGRDDPEAPPERVEAWEAVAGKEFTCTTLDGDHFFVKNHAERIVMMILGGFSANDESSESGFH